MTGKKEFDGFAVNLRSGEEAFSFRPPPPSPLVTIAEDNQASEFHKRLATWIEEFNQGLDQQHEVGVRLVNFGQTVVFHLDSIGYWNPSLILFQGTTQEGQPVELIQHVSQISILLTRLPRKDPNQPRRKIGFARPTDS